MSDFLETDRLALRALTTAGTDRLIALDHDPEVIRFISGGRPTNREAIETRALPRLLHGYATEGSRALIHKGFTGLEAEQVTANTVAVNSRSRHLR
ncbi:GNAT family N-acetyltransferase [Streptomyces sp. NPDC006435]|uniref:GNAT family N-acetyltransferase n=1 Tax=Streptomyces sp. NPDC006435 TaxID=3154300 RepID=UPI0033B94A82